MRRAFGWILATSSVVLACSATDTTAPGTETTTRGNAAQPLTQERVLRSVDDDVRPPMQRHPSRRHTPRAGAPEVASVRPSAAPPAPQPLLTYRGGPELESVQIHAVYWGPNVSLPTGADLPSYLTAISGNAPYFQMLAEYNVTTPNPLTIGSGTFAGTYVDVDAPIPASNTVTDEMVQAEVSRLIAQGKVTNAKNSLYVFFFPPGVAVDQDGLGTLSCQVFCGYHGGFPRNAGSTYYAIIPDFTQDCASGCGADPLSGMYETISHELVEAVNDPGVGQNDLAWYDDANGEIGDMCGGYAGTASGQVVQRVWSNEAHGCRDHKGTGVDTIVVTPAEQTVAAGSSTTFSLALAGNAGAADLTISGLPPSVTSGDAGVAGFAPASIAPGASATATLQVGATTRSSDYTFSAEATDATGVVHLAQPILHVVGPAPSITSIAPATGPTSGGTAVTVTGKFFGVGSSATVDGVPASGGYVGGTSGTQFAISMPSHAAGNATIVITNLNDAAHPATSPTKFVYTAGPAPTVTSVAPNAGPVGGGQLVVLKGTGFSSNMTIAFGGAAVDPNNEVFVDPTTIQIYGTPAHGAGPVDIVVTNADTQTGKLVNGYIYGGIASPGIDSLNVDQGPIAGGTYVTIYGGSFSSKPTVTLGGVQAQVQTISDSFVGIVTPAHAAGAAKVELTTLDGQKVTAATPFTYVASIADAGADGATEAGAGTDAGVDSGPGVDAGVDSGVTVDAGPVADAGVDSGTVKDSGAGTDSGAAKDSGAPADAGPKPVADAGGGGGGSDAAAGGGGGGEDSSGCGCSVPGQSSGGANALSLLALGAIAIAVDRRRARRRA